MKANSFRFANPGFSSNKSRIPTLEICAEFLVAFLQTPQQEY